MALFINGMANISPQKTWNGKMLSSDITAPVDDKLVAIEPDHSQYIDAKVIRRMSRIIKMGVTSASIALADANTKVPDGIITGTGYGCLEDTGVFLSKMIENKEVALNPTPFIQSTHNTIGSQIALLLQCQGYNQTYSQGGFSFESVLLDAMIQAVETPEKILLIGGVDEITQTSHTILRRMGAVRNFANGEGATFFVVSGVQKNAKVRVEKVATFYKPKIKDLREGLASVGRNFDVVITGSKDDSSWMREVPGLYAERAATARFKPLCGDYPTASAFALWLGTSILETQTIPQALDADTNPASIKSILIFNQYLESYYSAIAIIAC